MKKLFKNWPFVLCAMFPLLGIAVNSAYNYHQEWLTILGYWLISSTSLFIIYTILKKLLNGQLTSKTIIYIIGLLSSFVLVNLINIKFFNPMSANSTVNYLTILAVRYLFVGSIFAGGLLLIKYSKDRETFILNNSALQIENVSAKLNLLRNQINPHFLFNSLSTLRSMARNKEVQIEEYILNLSTVYRQILKNTDATKVSLKEELSFLNAYIFLLKINHENSLNVKIEITEESLQYNLPAFTLQLLIENCIKHNIVSQARPLEICIYNLDQKRLAVSNNLQPKKNIEESFGLGTNYIANSYILLKVENGIEIEKNDEHYKTILKLI